MALSKGFKIVHIMFPWELEEQGEQIAHTMEVMAQTLNFLVVG